MPPKLKEFDVHEEQHDLPVPVTYCHRICSSHISCMCHSEPFRCWFSCQILHDIFLWWLSVIHCTAQWAMADTTEQAPMSSVIVVISCCVRVCVVSLSGTLFWAQSLTPVPYLSVLLISFAMWLAWWHTSGTANVERCLLSQNLGIGS